MKVVWLRFDMRTVIFVLCPVSGVASQLQLVGTIRTLRIHRSAVK